MKISVIGAGNVGATLTRKLASLGHTVSVANSRGPETLTQLAAETGATATTVDDAVSDADIVFVSIPFKNVPALAAGALRALPERTVLVDTGNYVPKQRDGRIDDIENGMVESRWAQRHYGHPVIKAFNTVNAKSLAASGLPHGPAGRIAIPVAGDVAEAKAIVLKLVEQLGYEPVDAGGLDDSWRQQPGTPVYTADLDAERARRALADADPQRPAAWRA